MASLIRTRLSDLLVLATRSRHFWQGNLWVQLYPRMKTFLLVPCRANVPHPGAATLISAPRSNQLGKLRQVKLTIKA